MAEIKCVIGDTKTGKSFQKPIDSAHLNGRKIGDSVPGSIFELTGYELQVTGGSDNAGFPLVKSLEGSGRKRALLHGGVGVKIKRKGMSKRKTIRGNTISDTTAQVNLKVIKHGTKTVQELLGVEDKKEEKAEEKKEVPKPEQPKKVVEQPKEEKKEEVKAEEKPAEAKKEEVKPEEKKEEKPEVKA